MSRLKNPQSHPESPEMGRSVLLKGGACGEEVCPVGLSMQTETSKRLSVAKPCGHKRAAKKIMQAEAQTD